MDRKMMARLFALGVTPGDGGGGGTPPPPASGDGSAEDLERQVADLQAKLTDREAKLAKSNSENQGLRRGRNDAAALLKSTFGIEAESFDEVLAAAQTAVAARGDEGGAGGGGGTPAPPATGGKPPDDPRINMLLREVETLKTENKAAKEAAKEAAAREKATKQRAALNAVLVDAGIGPEDLPLAASYIRDPELGNFRADEDGESLIWTPRDPKTGKPVDVPFDRDSVETFLPKKFLPAKGGGGSGGGAPRPAGARVKASDEATKTIDSQEAYEKARAGKSEQEIAGLQRAIQSTVAPTE